MNVNSLEILSKDCILLLENNNLLIPLIKAEVTKSLISKVELKDAELQEILDNFLQTNNFKTIDEFDNFLSDKNISKKSLIEKASISYRIKTYSLEKFIHKTEGRFIKVKKGLDQVTYNILRNRDFNLCQELYFKIQDNEATFSSLSREFSEGIEKETNGLIGPVPLQSTHPILKEKLTSSQIGEINPPIKIKEFWVISRLERIERAQLNDDMKIFLSNQMFDESVSEITNELHGKLIAKTLKT